MTCLQNLGRHRRLLSVCAVSAALHLLAIGWLARSIPLARRPPPQSSIQPSPLSVRLPAAAPALPVEAMSAPAPASAPAASLDASPSGTRPAPPRSPPSAPAATPARQPEGSANPVTVTGQVPGQGWDVAAEGDAAASAHRPGFEAVRAPPSAVLAYAIVRDVPGQPPAGAGAGRLEWTADDRGYRLSLDGVMGELESRGLMTDSGFGPLEARARAGAQTLVTAFDWAASRVSFDGAGRGAAVTGDGQDRASMLMRLAGMGLAGAVQLNGTIELLVAGADGVAVVRFERVGEEEIDSALGKLATVHLVQVTRPGNARLDVWLAPSSSWYPVQLRVTAPDGSALTQTVTSIAPL
ncbi:MAG: hypothetical protein JWR65_2123 [Massilia sp.]|nr:hypothetical protein [Massilia sp.]